MDINQYSIYTTVSKNENKNQDDLAKASEITAMLHKFDNAENAKEWLKEIFKFWGNKKIFPIEYGVSITTKSNKTSLNVIVQQKNKIMTFNYSSQNKE
mgnify:CR=1 FL=1